MGNTNDYPKLGRFFDLLAKEKSNYADGSFLSQLTYFTHFLNFINSISKPQDKWEALIEFAELQHCISYWDRIQHYMPMLPRQDLIEYHAFNWLAPFINPLIDIIVSKIDDLANNKEAPKDCIQIDEINAIEKFEDALANSFLFKRQPVTDQFTHIQLTQNMVFIFSNLEIDDFKKLRQHIRDRVNGKYYQDPNSFIQRILAFPENSCRYRLFCVSENEKMALMNQDIIVQEPKKYSDILRFFHLSYLDTAKNTGKLISDDFRDGYDIRSKNSDQHGINPLKNKNKISLLSTINHIISSNDQATINTP